MKPRWSVCIGGYPHGWEPPLVETDDPREAVRVYAEATENPAHMTTVAIFDDHGEGEPLDPEQVEERLADEQEVTEIFCNRRWVKVDWYIFRSWSGRRRLGGKPYYGPTALLGHRAR